MAEETYSEDQLKLLREAQRLMSLIGIDMEKQADIQDEILAGTIKNTKQLQENVAVVRKHVKEEKELLKAEEAKEKAANDYAGILQSTLKPLEKIGSITADSLQKDKEKIAAALELGVISQDNADILLGQLDTLNKLASNPIAKKGFETAAESLDSMQSSIDGFMKKIPGGDFISKSLGIDKIGENLQNSLLDGSIKGAGAAAIVAGAFVAVAAVLDQITTEAKKLSTETGLTFGQAMKLNNEMREASVSFKASLATQKDLVEVQKASIAEFGAAGILSGEVAANVAQTGKAFGYGAVEAGKVNTQFMLMGLSGEDAAQAQENLAASALRAGVNVGAVIKDISTNSKEVAKYFGGNVEKLKAAAIEAQKLGLNLAQMGKIAGGLLDIETSLSSQFEFQAISGKEINLDTARQLALTNDIAGAAKEVVTQFGSLAELQAMGPLAMEAAAKAAGLTVDELTKSMAVQERLGELNVEEQAAMNNLGLSAAEIKNLTDEQLKTKLAEQQAIDASSKSFENIKNQLMTALVPLAETLGAVFSALAPVLTLIAILLIPITDAIKGVVGLTQNLVGLFTGASTELTNMQIILGTIAGIYLLIKGYALGTQIIEGITLGIKAAQGAMDARRALVAKGGLIRSIGEAAMKVIQSFSSIPIPGVGTALGLAAAGTVITLGYKFLNTGDLAMSSGGGPIVTNPREGTIFQGTKNDEVAMGPGVIGAAQRTQPVMMAAQQQQASSAGSAAAMGEQNRILAQIAEGQKTPAPIQIGTNVIREINTSVQVDKSFNKLGSYNK